MAIAVPSYYQDRPDGLVGTQPAGSPPVQLQESSDISKQIADYYQSKGGSFGADEQNDLANRRRNGQTDEQILANTRQQADSRFPGGSGGGSSAPAFKNTSPSFTDPSQKLIEDSALARYQHLQNPEATSGTGIFEQYARELIDTLKGPVYSAGDEATIKAGAMDSIFKDRDLTKQRWLEEVSKRGMAPSSGPALEGLRRIDEQYKTLQTTVDAEFARNAIQQTRDQRFQTLNTAGQLANSEESRLSGALDVARIPYNLNNDAFSRNLSLVNAGGSPQQLLSSAMSLFNSNQSGDAYASQSRQQLAQGLLQYLGWAYGG